MRNVVTDNVIACARCGNDHAAVTFRPLSRSTTVVPGLTITHWAECPVNGEPILMAREAAPDA